MRENLIDERLERIERGIADLRTEHERTVEMQTGMMQAITGLAEGQASLRSDVTDLKATVSAIARHLEVPGRNGADGP